MDTPQTTGVECTVPANVATMNIIVVGGGGGGSAGAAGGSGAKVTVTDYAVTPGDTLRLFIGSGGAAGVGDQGGGGAGGSALYENWDDSPTLLAAAGGGGGAGGTDDGGGPEVTPAAALTEAGPPETTVQKRLVAPAACRVAPVAAEVAVHLEPVEREDLAAAVVAVAEAARVQAVVVAAAA